MVKDEYPMRVDFVYKGTSRNCKDYKDTAREFVDLLEQPALIEVWLFQEGKRGLPLYPPKVQRREDGTPVYVEFWGTQEVEVPGEQDPAVQRFTGIRLVLSPLPGPKIKVEAECLHPAFQSDLDEILKKFGVKSTADSIAKPEEIIRQLPGYRGSEEWNKALWDWYYAYTEHHRYSVYPDVGKLTDYSPSHIRRLKSLYDAEYKQPNKDANDERK